MASCAVAQKGRSQHAITCLLALISMNQSVIDTRHGHNDLSPQFDYAAQVISCDSLIRVLLTFINELPLAHLILRKHL